MFTMTCGCVCRVVEGVYPPGVVRCSFCEPGGLVFLEILVFLKELVFLMWPNSSVPTLSAPTFSATVATSGFLSFLVFLEELVFLCVPLEPAPATTGSGKYR